jgi:vacuolar iron transporter family protein
VESENHFVKRSGWLRASMPGANDGILSTTSLAIGVAAASVARDPIILATLAGVVAGGLKANWQ